MNRVHNTVDTSALSKKPLLDAWLEERKQLLAKYCELAGLAPYEPTKSLPSQSHINGFCEVLMDYISAGHFSIYNATSSMEHLAEHKSEIELHYANIRTSTDMALNFNDDYAESDGSKEFDQFDVQLSGLGQMLEERFEIEDALIHILYQKND